MPMHISPSISKDPGHIATMFPQINPIVNPPPPATQGDILDILQREQDRAVALLSSSPLLASLFVSYANQAAALDSATATPTSESDEWKALENTIATLQEEVDRLKPENVEMARSLGAATASQEAFRSQVSALKEVNSAQLDDIKSLRAELFEAKRTHKQLLVDSDLERESLQTQISELEARQQELKETVVEQQVQIMKLQCRGPTGLSSFSNAPAMVETAGTTDSYPSCPQMSKDTSKSSKRTEKAAKPAKSKKNASVSKRPLSAYMFFSQDWRERIKAENPDAGFGEIGKLLGAKWKEMDEEEKKPYVEQAAADKIRAEKETDAFTSKKEKKEESVGNADEEE